MRTGIDTGFFFALQTRSPVSLEVWNRLKLVTSTIVLYELQKTMLRGAFQTDSDILTEIQSAVSVLPVTTPIALRAARLAHGTDIPGLDALVLATMLEAGCQEIYTTDSDLAKYESGDVRIINLRDAAGNFR